MTTNNVYHKFNDNELTVLAFLKNLKQYAPDKFDTMIFYGASAREMIKFMEHPEKYGDFDFLFVCGLFDSIRKTFKHYIIEQPEIEVQVEEDRIIAAILMNYYNAFRTIYENRSLINKSHLYAYLMREDEIYKWNGWLLFVVQKTVEEMKEDMQMKFVIAG